MEKLMYLCNDKMDCRVVVSMNEKGKVMEISWREANDPNLETFFTTKKCHLKKMKKWLDENSIKNTDERVGELEWKKISAYVWDCRVMTNGIEFNGVCRIMSDLRIWYHRYCAMD
jgi:hypothetical protein